MNVGATEEHCERHRCCAATLLRRVPVVLELARLAARRGVGQRDDLRLRARLDAELRESQRFLRLRLRAHDPLQRGVARLVDRVRDGDHRRQRRLDHVVAELGLPLAARLAVGDRQLGDLRDHGPAQALRDRRPEHGAVGVCRLLAEEHEVGVLTLERGGEHAARADEVGAGSRVVGHEHGPVGAHRERLAEGVGGLRRPHRDEHDLPASGPVLDPERLLDGMGVEGVQRPLTRAIKPLRGRVDALRALRNLFDADRDLHPARTLSRYREALTHSENRVTLRPFARDPGAMTPHRTTARGLLVLTLLALTGAARGCCDGAAGAAVSSSRSSVKVSYTNDFGAPRGNWSHTGQRLDGPEASLAVAAESGKVKFWTSSSRAGCMLYLYGDSGTTYLYIHLNNDLTAKNDNRG